VNSADGINWQASSTTNLVLYAVAYGNGTFVATGEITNGGPVVLLSSNGMNWTPQGAPYESKQGVTYASGQFVAVGVAGQILTSSDGANWIFRHGGYGFADLYSVTYGNGRFVALGAGGTILESGSLNLALTLDLDPSSGLLRLSLTGATAQAYTVQSSTDLVSWESITNFTSAQSTTVVLDPLAPATRQRFFRAVSH
jgi:hypothetical protein